VATAARNSTKADGDVIGGRSKQANGAIAVLALIAGRSDLQIATAVRGRNAVQCSAVQCGGCCCDASSVMGAKQKGEKEFGALCCGWGALRCMRENPTDPCVHAVQILA
jgi:hypothetical protein